MVIIPWMKLTNINTNILSNPRHLLHMEYTNVDNKKAWIVNIKFLIKNINIVTNVEVLLRRTR